MKPLFYTAGSSPALTYAVSLLKEAGIPFTTHTDLSATHLLLPTPSFTAKGTLVGGDRIEAILPQLSGDVIVIGGNLSHEALGKHRKVDLLRDDTYLAANAAITAHCTIRYILENVPFILKGCPVLVIGWGRIGKCLAQLLKAMGAQVTVAARKSADRAILEALGYQSISIDVLDSQLYPVIVNTVPFPVLHGGAGLKIDLASQPGIIAPDVIWARGLPGKDAPESSGKLIADFVLQNLEGGSL